MIMLCATCPSRMMRRNDGKWHCWGCTYLEAKQEKQAPRLTLEYARQPEGRDGYILVPR